MLRILLFFLFIHLSLVCHAQDQNRYINLAEKAWDFYKEKQYLKSAQTYSEAFSVLGGKGYIEHRYNAACAWAWAGKPDSAFVQLFKISENGLYTDLNAISNDTKLTPLHNDPRWKKVIDLVVYHKHKSEANLEPALVARLDSIFHDDQDGRERINGRIGHKEMQGEDTQKLMWSIHRKDSINQIKVTKILDERGWLGADVVGKQGNSTLFLVIQHADLSIQEKYLPMMRDAVKNGKAKGSSLALLEDRVALRKGGLQTYGSQVGTNGETGDMYVLPLADPDHVNERRKEVGLGTIEEYISHWGMKWDSEDYKKKLPEYIRIQKK